MAHTHVNQYLKKYEARMAAKNSKFLRDLAQLAFDFIKYFKSQWKLWADGDQKSKTKTIEVMDCLTELDIYRLDFTALNAFFDKADLIRKLNGYV